jgi:ribosome-associated toxin RatA of RatAB toxin-antitoxin module
MKVTFSIIAFLAAISAGGANGAEPSPDQLNSLLAGEVVSHAVESGKAGGSARMQILARAPAKAIWDVIVSCEKAFVFVDGLEVCEVLEDSGDRALVHQVVKRGWPIPTQNFVFESLRNHYREIGFQLVEGNLKAMEGNWRFDETAEGTLVDYQIRVQPAIAAPKFIVRRSIEKGMPDLLACIRGLAGGSLSADQARKDVQRCPGEAEALPAR